MTNQDCMTLQYFQNSVDRGHEQAAAATAAWWCSILKAAKADGCCVSWLESLLFLSISRHGTRCSCCCCLCCLNWDSFLFWVHFLESPSWPWRWVQLKEPPMKISLCCSTNTQESSYSKNGCTVNPHPILRSQEFYFMIHFLSFRFWGLGST